MNTNAERLKETIKADCREWERLANANALIQHYLYLNECENSKNSGLYQLILNGLEVWYGTLAEINAIVKSLLTLTDKRTEYNL